MLIYNGLRGLGALALGLRDLLNDWGVAIFRVFLIGEHLAPYLFLASSKMYTTWIQLNQIAADWLDFYHWVTTNIQPGNIVGQLLYWADDLISLVRYFNEWVDDVLHKYYLPLWSFARNPSGYLISLLLSYTGLTQTFLSNPQGTIQTLINQALGDLRALINNPGEFIIDALRSYYPNFAIILQDPDGWLADRLGRLSPALVEFLRDPDGYILKRLFAALDNLSEDSIKIVVELTSRILNNLW